MQKVYVRILPALTILFFSFILFFLYLPKTAKANTIYWEDNFQRADGDAGNGWASVDGATGQISSNQLLRTDSGAYRVFYNPTNVTLPADYYVTVTIPDTTVTRNYWGLMGRYLSTGANGNGSGNKIFWTDQGLNNPGVGHADFFNDITPTITGGIPASWSLNQSHTVTLYYSGTTVTVYLDGSEYGYFTDTTNNQTGTGVAVVGDGGGTAYLVSDIMVTDYLPTGIYDESITNISSDSATITWQTAFSSTSTVNYGLTTSYGNAATDSAMVTSHSVTLTGLTSGTTYYVQALSTDGSNNTYTSLDQTFETSIPPPPSNEIGFETTGSTFSPILTVSAGATIQWTFGDGSTSSSSTPSVSFGSAASRMNTLVVTPWSALTDINIGFDAADAGPNTIAQIPQQNVTEVYNLNNVAPYLTTWASNYNPLTTLDFSNFTQLTDAECYGCTALSSVTLTNTPVLSRAVFEEGKVDSLDFSTSPLIADIRGAAMTGSTYSLTFGSSGADVWHLCVRDNPQITGLPDLSNFPSLKDLWIYNDHLTGTLHPISKNLISVQAWGNSFSSADFSGDFPSGDGNIMINGNKLTTLDVTSDPGLMNLDAHDNLLGQSTVDSILQTMDSYNTSNGTLDLSTNSLPTAASQQSIVNLLARGWTVTLDHNATSETATPQSNGATITWNTDFKGSTKINYGLTSSFTSSTPETDTLTRVLSHSAALTGLLPCTIYHYQGVSVDASASETDGTDNTFTTTGCTGSASVITQTQSQIASSGGQLALLDGNSHGLTLTVPPSFSNATSSANFQVQQLDKAATLNTTSTPNSYSLIGDYVYGLESLSDISTKISSFDNSLTVSISYGSSDMSGIDESTLKIYRYDSGTWTQLSGCAVDTSAKTVTCTTNNFSDFGLFGQPSPAVTIVNIISNTVSNVISAFFCSSPKPSLAPNLYEIDVNDTTARIYFSPAGDPYSSHYISYGQGKNTEGYGVNLLTSHSSGAIFYNVRSLSPNTTYSFKVRGGNGCSTGDWSNSLTIHTQAKQSNSIKKFYSFTTDSYSHSSSMEFLGQKRNVVSKPSSTSANSSKITIPQHKNTSPSVHNSPPASHTTLWESVITFLKNSFHL